MQPTQRAAIIGVTGFVGRGLPARLAELGISSTGISRAGSGNVPGVDRWQRADQLDFSDHSAVINLAGEPIDRRWTTASKRMFHESRVGLTNRVVDAIGKLPPDRRPQVLINASAVGIYGDRGDEILMDGAARGDGYLADLCSDWEDSAKNAEALGVRVVRLRIGIVLGKDGPAFKKLMFVFKLGVGGKLGSGHQWMPWIHLEDLRGGIVHAVSSPALSGSVNGTAPHPLKNSDFTKTFAASVHRPAFFHAPGFALKLALGGFGGALLAGQRALPAALEKDGFQFRFPTLESALADLT